MVIRDFKKVKNESGYTNWTRSMHPFYTATESLHFTVDENSVVVFKIWWGGITGNVGFYLYDEDNNPICSLQGGNEDSVQSFTLANGTYSLQITQSYFTGAVAIGFDNVVILQDLDERRYTYVQRNPEKGFYWDYILYIPEHIKHNRILVVPNNTGKVTDNYTIHREKAKSLIQSKSELADSLQVPLLVPVFPRPLKEQDLYTHALDRNSILTEIEALQRLDNQLISMFNDAKELLESTVFGSDTKLLMSGFSASGDFVDRFVFLHPSLVEAAVIGGSDAMIPLTNLRGANLFYPIGIYDYEKITEKAFDAESFAAVHKLIYKGSDDCGGWQIVQKEGVTVKYTWQEYYKQYLLPQLLAHSEKGIDHATKPLLSEEDLDNIKFKAFEGKILIDRFKEIANIYEELNIHNTTFKLYEGIGHTITDEIKQDELSFFMTVLQNV